MQPSNDSAACLGAVASAAPVPISLDFSVNVIALPVLPDSLSLCKFFIFYPFFVCVVPVPVCQGQWKAFLPPFFETGEGGAVLKKVISQACVPGPTTTLALSHSAESFVHTHIVCSPLHSFFFLFLFLCGSGCQQLLRVRLFACVECVRKHAEANKES